MKRCLNCMHVYSSEYDICPSCGYVYDSKPRSEHYLMPGTIINNRYQVGTVIGSGGFGITYIGLDIELQLKIAIKEYFPNAFASRTGNRDGVSILSEGNNNQYQAGLKRFLDEGRSLAKFNEENEIVHVYDYIEANNTAYLIMEFIEGETLSEYMQREDKISIDEVITIAQSISNGLEKIHKKNLIHRDISPDNIMLCGNGDVKLLDFGAARFFTNRETQQFSVILKPSYAPPEQYASTNKQDARVDIYALGAVLYVMLTGVKPQEAAGRMYEDELKSLCQINPEIPESVDKIVLKCLALKAQDRYQNIKELKDALDKLKTTPDDDDKNVDNEIVTEIIKDDSHKNDEEAEKPRNSWNKKLLIIPAIIIILGGMVALLTSGVKDIKGLEAETEIYIGDTLKPEYIIEPQKKSNETITFDGFDNKIISVNSDGEITAEKIGETKLVLHAGKYEEEVNIIVKAKVTDIYNVDKTIEIEEGQTETINPKLKPDKFSDCKIEYKIKNKAIAEIDKSGNITAKSPGTTELVIKSGGYSETVKIVVTEYVAPVQTYNNQSYNQNSNQSSERFYNDFEQVW